MPVDIDAANRGEVSIDVLNTEPASQTASPLVAVQEPKPEGPSSVEALAATPNEETPDAS